MSYCFLVPHYNHSQQFIEFLPLLLSTGLPIVVVDDGSEREQLDLLESTLRDIDNVFLYAHPRNRGKGAAALAGLTHASALGFTHAIQIDADGQHKASDVEQFIALSKTRPRTIVCGKPVFDESAPKVRLYGRKITDFWVALETLSLKIKDSLCGFRIYPLACLEEVADRYYLGRRMDFDTEVLVKSIWAGIDIEFLPTKVVYLEDSVSHFHYLKDNISLIKLHTRLMIGMIVRAPILIFRRVRNKQ